MEYFIFSDVSMDIDVEFALQNDVRYIPMEYQVGDRNYVCESPETEDRLNEYYGILRKDGDICTHTSQITPNNYLNIFEPLIKEGKQVLYLALSSGLSNTYESALLAAKQLNEDYDNVCIEVVDTKSASIGMGLLGESAVNNRNAGMSLTENAEWLRNQIKKLEFYFKVEDVRFLKRGGRLTSAQANIAIAFNIKPIIRCDENGKLEVIEKKRGTKLAIKCICDRFEELFDEKSGNVIYVSHSGNREEAEKLKSQILEKHPALNVRITSISPIIGAHTGPDTLMIAYYNKN